jgi:transcriptional regulator with XRE-family HTH domain
MTAIDGPPAETDLGNLLRYWRRLRGKSQLDLAAEALTTPRYVSFVETGRSQPSREMVHRLARALDVPLREQNGLFLAAGYAPPHRGNPLDAPQLSRVATALASMLDKHEPFPAVVMDRGWTVLRANAGAASLFGMLLAPDPIPEAANVLRLMIEPGRVRDRVANWEDVAPALLERVRHEAVGGVLDASTAELVEHLRSRPDVAALLREPGTPPADSPVLDVQFRLDGAALSFFSVVSTIGTPVDVTAQELRVESFFPSDEQTREAWTHIAAGPSASD